MPTIRFTDDNAYARFSDELMDMDVPPQRLIDAVNVAFDADDMTGPLDPADVDVARDALRRCYAEATEHGSHFVDVIAEGSGRVTIAD